MSRFISTSSLARRTTLSTLILALSSHVLAQNAPIEDWYTTPIAGEVRTTRLGVGSDPPIGG